MLFHSQLEQFSFAFELNVGFFVAAEYNFEFFCCYSLHTTALHVPFHPTVSSESHLNVRMKGEKCAKKIAKIIICY